MPSPSPVWCCVNQAWARVPMPGLSEDLKPLVDARQQSVGERTRVLNRLHAHLVILLPGYERTV